MGCSIVLADPPTMEPGSLKGLQLVAADPDGNAWVVQQIRARADKPLLSQVD
jgi:hypothetical protein